jgi:hypothetical protein
MALIEARNSLLTAIGSIERRFDLLEKRPRAVRFSRATPKRAVRIRNRLLRCARIRSAAAERVIGGIAGSVFVSACCDTLHRRRIGYLSGQFT